MLQQTCNMQGRCGPTARPEAVRSYTHLFHLCLDDPQEERCIVHSKQMRVAPGFVIPPQTGLNLVVAAPYHDAWVAAEAHHLLTHLSPDILQESCIPAVRSKDTITMESAGDRGPVA